jgi:hypothetical protein
LNNCPQSVGIFNVSQSPLRILANAAPLELHRFPGWIDEKFKCVAGMPDRALSSIQPD